jgi:hypothetical protein
VLDFMSSSTPRAYGMRGTSLTVLLLSAQIVSVVAAPASDEAAGVGPPPALTQGQPPSLPKQGPLAEPRSQDQLGIPAALTASVIPPAVQLRLRQQHWAKSCFSRAGSQVMALWLAPRVTIRLAPSPMAGLYQSASAAALVNATPRRC